MGVKKLVRHTRGLAGAPASGGVSGAFKAAQDLYEGNDGGVEATPKQKLWRSVRQSVLTVLLIAVIAGIAIVILTWQ